MGGIRSWQNSSADAVVGERTTRRWCRVAVLAVSQLMLPGWVLAADTAWGRAPLTGLQAVYVGIEKIDEGIQSATGITIESLRTLVELRLRQSGIKVQSSEEADRAPGFDYLDVKVGLVKHGSDPQYVYAIEIEMRQDVRLSRDPSVEMSAPTWESTDSLGYADHSVVRDTIRRLVEEKTDAFCNAWLSVNPKAEPGK